MSESFSSRRYLLAPKATDADVAVVATKLGWAKLGEISQNSADLVSREVIWGASDQLTLHYSEDFLSRSPHFFVTGHDRAKVDVAARFAQGRLRPATLDELVEAFDDVSGDLADEILATLRLGLGSPLEFDERFFDRVRKSMSSADEGLRRAAVWATLYAVWEQYIPVLLEVAERDHSEQLRAEARMVIQAYRMQGVGGD
ncbi:hypothetical protein [Kibdelosporangium aridum]|uniref:Uncharacterized protein n=1 Tax=Kibdelosporangium aridum TaxID=2030 RepID=A0A1W1ZHI7_KIBAR|nr:hypothetical protein [Kibdelosporangium aridum]SMC47652.1 hypothetical protein SAMN05661093_00053 [Kibdelosporangium aridum]